VFRKSVHLLHRLEENDIEIKKFREKKFSLIILSGEIA